METRRSHSKSRAHHHKANKQWIAAASTLVVGTGIAMAHSTVVHAETVPGGNGDAQATETVPGTTTPSEPVTLGSDTERAATTGTENSETGTENAESTEGTKAAASEDATKKAATPEKKLAARLESVDSETVKREEADAGHVVDDQSHNYTDYVNGQEHSETVGGVTVKLDSDVINAKTSTSTSTQLHLNGGNDRWGNLHRFNSQNVC
jgi:hypothetical protein